MLKDDVISGGNWLLDRTKRFMVGALKGALLFGALAIVGYGAYMAVMATSAFTAGAFAAHGILGGIVNAAAVTAVGIFETFKVGLGLAATNSGLGAIFAGARPIVLGSAFLGSAATAVASVVPSVKDWFRSSPPAPPFPSSSFSPVGDGPAATLSQNPVAKQQFPEFDNPYATQSNWVDQVTRNQAAVDTAGRPRI